VVIDTPLKLPRIWEQASGLTSVFADVESIARSCRFANCATPASRAARWRRVAPERLAALEHSGARRHGGVAP
jgi:hypothetical protein